MSFNSLLVHKVNIGTYTSSQNSLGEWNRTWTYSDNTTDCRLQSINAERRKDFPGYLDNVTYTAFFKSGTSISVNNRIQYGNNYYVVQEKSIDSSGHHIKTYLREL